jgi:hypothetical protein
VVFTVGGQESRQRIVKALRESVDAMKTEEARNTSDASAWRDFEESIPLDSALKSSPVLSSLMKPRRR